MYSYVVSTSRPETRPIEFKSVPELLRFFRVHVLELLHPTPNSADLSRDALPCSLAGAGAGLLSRELYSMASPVPPDDENYDSYFNCHC